MKLYEAVEHLESLLVPPGGPYPEAIDIAIECIMREIDRRARDRVAPARAVRGPRFVLEIDLLNKFIDQCCVKDKSALQDRRDFIRQFNSWLSTSVSERFKERPMSFKKISRLMRQNGYKKRKMGGRMYIKGLYVRKRMDGAGLRAGRGIYAVAGDLHQPNG